MGIDWNVIAAEMPAFLFPSPSLLSHLQYWPIAKRRQHRHNAQPHTRIQRIGESDKRDRNLTRIRECSDEMRHELIRNAIKGWVRNRFYRPWQDDIDFWKSLLEFLTSPKFINWNSPSSLMHRNQSNIWMADVLPLPILLILLFFFLPVS